MIVRIFGTGNTRLITFLFLMAMATFVTGLFTDVTRDASKYAAVAREMYETGDFINLRVHGQPYHQKPPMLFWMSALSFRLFGLSNFAFKLPLLLLSFWGLYSTYRLGKSLYNPETGLIAAIFLGSSQIFFLYNMDIHTDTVLLPFVTFALWQLSDFLKTGRTMQLIMGFCGIGLAMLTKGPVGAVVPAFAVAGYLLFTRQLHRLADIRWFIGILIASILILPALAGLFNQFGWEGVRFYFWTNNIGRITGKLVSKDYNFLFYVHNLLYLFLPWMVLLFISVFLQFRSLLAGKLKGPDWFVFSGIWFFFILLSVSHGKLPNYILILMPLFSVLTAGTVYIAVYGAGKQLLQYFLAVQHIVTALLSLCLIAMISWFYPVSDAWKIVIMIMMAGAALWPFFHTGPPAGKLLLPSLTMIIAFNFFLNQHVAPQIFSDQASVKAAEIFNRTAAPEERLNNYNYFSHELFFYGKTPVVQVKDDLALFELMKKPGNWVLTTGEVVGRMPSTEFPEPEVIPLKHVWINNLTFNYLNPRTREISYDTLYLLRSTAISPVEKDTVRF